MPDNIQKIQKLGGKEICLIPMINSVEQRRVKMKPTNREVDILKLIRKNSSCSSDNLDSCEKDQYSEFFDIDSLYCRWYFLDVILVIFI